MLTRRSIRRLGSLTIAALFVIAAPAELLAANRTQQRTVRGKAQQQQRHQCRLRAGRGQLAAGTPRIDVTSYNGIQWRAPQPRRVPSRTGNRWVGRGRDPMAVVVRGDVQPDSTLTIHAQQKARKLDDKEISAAKGCDGLRAVADSAVVWKKHIDVKPVVASVKDQHTTIFKERDQVLMPNTPIKITGATRDGKAYAAVHGQVQGLREQSETRFNFETQRAENFRIGGRFLKSAEAWVEAGNLLISQPVRDAKLAGRGKSFLKIAKGLTRSAKKLERKVANLQTKITANKYQNAQDRTVDQTLIQKLTQAVPKVQQKAKYFETQGNKMLTEGRQLRAEIFSVGAVPNGAQVTISNPRLAGEGAARASNSATGDIKNGYFRSSIGGIHQDRVVTTVAFPGDASKKASQVVLEARIPNSRDKTQKPVMITGSKRRPVKLYRLTPERVEATHQPADTQ